MEDTQRYLINGEIGRGTSSVVYRARDLLSGREVALKVLSPEAASAEQAREHLRREARLLSRLRHPGFVRVLDFVESRKGPALVTELVTGQTLQQRLAARSAMPLEEAISLVVQAARALGAAHRVGIIHGDVKPSNLLVTPEGDLRIADLGISRALRGEGDRGTCGPMRGTPSYLAPEQWRGEAVDGRADLFALGVVLYRLVSGERPFRGTDLRQLVAATLHGEPAPPSTLRSDLPAALDTICLRLLRSRPDERPATGDELAESLEGLVLGRVADGAPAARAGEAGCAEDRFDSTWPRLPVSPRRARAGRALLAAVLAVVLIGAGLAVFEGGRGSRVVPPSGRASDAPPAPVSARQEEPGSEPVQAWSAARRPNADLIDSLTRAPRPGRPLPSPATGRLSPRGERVAGDTAPRRASEPRPAAGLPSATEPGPDSRPLPAFEPRPASQPPPAGSEPLPPASPSADADSHAARSAIPTADPEPDGDPAALARGVVEIRHDLLEGLVELRVDSRRAGLARIGAGGAFAAEEPVVVSFRVPPGRHDCEVRVLSASSGGEATVRWTTDWEAGEFRPLRFHLLRRMDGWRLESSRPSTMTDGG